MKKKHDDHHLNLLGEQRPGDPRLHAHLPGGYVGPYVVTFGDRLKLEEGGEVIIDVPSTEDTIPIFSRLILALLNELKLVMKTIESVSRPQRVGFRRPAVKRFAVLNALTRIQSTGTSSKVSLEEQVHALARQELDELARRDPEMYGYLLNDKQPVTLRYVRKLLSNPNTQDDQPSAPSPEPYPEVGVSFRYVARRRIVLTDLPKEGEKEGN